MRHCYERCQLGLFHLSCSFYAFDCDKTNSHIYKGSIHDHFISYHGQRPNKSQLQDNTSILSKAEDRYRLSIKEALLISQRQPSINRQFETFTHTLKLFRNSRPSNISNHHLSAPQTVPNNVSPNTQPINVPLIDPAQATTHPSHVPPGSITNSPVSPSIQSRINNLYLHTLNNNPPHHLLEDLEIELFQYINHENRKQ